MNERCCALDTSYCRPPCSQYALPITLRRLDTILSDVSVIPLPGQYHWNDEVHTSAVNHLLQQIPEIGLFLESDLLQQDVESSIFDVFAMRTTSAPVEVRYGG